MIAFKSSAMFRLHDCCLSFVVLLAGFAPVAAATVPARSRDGVVNGTDEIQIACGNACAALSEAIPGKVWLSGSVVYDDGGNYWSAFQTEVHPRCRVMPTSASDVSTTVQILVENDCRFAVKSGGHAAFTGASNVEAGVTIDLIDMNAIAVSEDESLVGIGSGSTWSQVYLELDKLSLGVVGGRVADIGVGGLTLGGGISFFSGRYGFACDNVVNYEVVFADGSIHNVNFTSFPDLYWALRGGGNNFGIVTRFDLATFVQELMWAGLRGYSSDKWPALIDGLVHFTDYHENDPYAAFYVAYAWVQQLGSYYISTSITYGISVSNPPILQEVAAVPYLTSTMRITNVTALSLELNALNPKGFRQSWWTLTVHNDATLLHDIRRIWEDELESVKNVSGIIPALLYQPISKAMTSHGGENGGNALGLSHGDGALILVQTSLSWTSTADDDAMHAFGRCFLDRSKVLAAGRGLLNRFVYQNYAAPSQRVFEGYGLENLRKLREVSEKYDPQQVWQRLQPGYFKL